MKIILILLATAVVIFLEKTNITNKWDRREKIVFFISLFIGTSITAAWALQVNLINPMEILTELYHPISEPFISYMNQFK
ncbi:hypothetical protein ACFYKT_12455 [Cytobacillus sp. FJAT-53684]|uniref:Uncharacterized protein n=1 Tax=Cytobacillus mangrovibacter TaxID=3299024 RepID=A0ABW6K0L4_9BACI